MFKRFMKTALSLAMSIAIILSVTVFASAAGEPGVTVKLSPVDLIVADIQVKEGRTYAPYNYLFEALGATATFADGTITAVLGSTTVTFKLGDNKMTVAVGLASQSVTINAVPYQDISKRIYVPVRFAAQALGFVVSWDASNQSIVLQSVDDLITQSGATYTLIDKYLASQKEFSAKKHAASGSFSLTMNIAAAEGATPTPPLTVNGTLSGLVAQSSAEMNMKMTSNATAFAGSLGGTDTMNDQNKLIMSMLDKFEMNMIVNSQTGMIYIQAPILTTLLGQKTDSWLSMDLNKLSSGVSLSTLNTTGNFKEYLSSMLKSMCMTDFGSSSVNIKELLKQLNAMISDQAFVKDGSNYVSTSSIDVGSGNASEKLVLKLTMKFNGTTYSGMAVDVSMDMGAQGALSMTCGFDAAGSGSLKMNLAVPSVLTMDMTETFIYTETTLSPAVQPPTGSTIVPIDKMLSSMTPGLTA